jgi:tetratricopeptide (TPR) repeat protein
MTNLVIIYRNQGRLGEATELQRKVLRISGRVFGEEYPQILAAMINLGMTYSDQGRDVEAAALQEKVLHRIRDLGENHSSTLDIMFHLGVIYRQ